MYVTIISISTGPAFDYACITLLDWLLSDQVEYTGQLSHSEIRHDSISGPQILSAAIICYLTAQGSAYSAKGQDLCLSFKICPI